MSPQESSGNGAHDHRPPIGERVEHIGTSAQQLWNEARDVVNDLTQTLDFRSRVQKHPYLMLAAAAGVGYILGGGLFTGLTARLLRLGFRLAAIPLVKDELVSMAEGALGRFNRGEEQGGQQQSTGG